MATLSELKASFSEITNLPAKKAYVFLAAPSMQGRGMRSKADWEAALEKIERILAPIELVIRLDAEMGEAEPSVVVTREDLESSVEQEPELVQPSIVEQELEPLDEEVSDIEESIASGTNPERAFVCGFAISQNPKQLYRRLARKYHPDTNKGIDAGLFGILSEVYEKYTEVKMESQEIEETDDWGSVTDLESYEKVKKMFS